MGMKPFNRPITKKEVDDMGLGFHPTGVLPNRAARRNTDARVRHQKLIVFRTSKLKVLHQDIKLKSGKIKTITHYI